MPRSVSKVLIVSTPSIEGCPVTHYAGFVTARAVMGAGLLKDMGAWLTDWSGGRSGGYEEELERATQAVLKELQRKAARLGANCILSVSVQTEAIGGKNLSMLAVAAEGTAVVVDFAQSKYPGIIAESKAQAKPIEKQLNPMAQARLFAFTQGLRSGRFVHDSGGLSTALGASEAAWDEIDLNDVFALWFGKSPVPFGNDEGIGAIEFLRSRKAAEVAHALVACTWDPTEDAASADAIVRGVYRDPFDMGAALVLLRAKNNAAAQVVGLRLICEQPVIVQPTAASQDQLAELEAALKSVPDLRTGSEYASRDRALELLAQVRDGLASRA